MLSLLLTTVVGVAPQDVSYPEVYARWVDDQPLAALEALAEELRTVGPTLQPGGDQLLADQLEVGLVLYRTIADELDNPLLAQRLLEGLAIDPGFGALNAELARARGEVGQQLHPLVRWEIVGPFDNERGRGMTRATPAEKTPGDASYEGKVRDVQWRALPSAAPPDGVVRCASLLEPDRQCCVVARCWVRSAARQDVLLLLSATEEVRLWANGAPLFEALEEHELGADTFAVPVELANGWTELVLKVGSNEGTPAFLARLVDPVQGRALQLETSASAPEGVAPTALKDPRRKIREPRLGARPGAWRRYAEDGTGSGRTAFALLRLDAQDAPRSARPGAAEAASAAAQAPASLGAHLLNLATLREAGASAVEEDLTPWLNGLKDGLARFGDRPRLLRELARHALGGQRSIPRARSLVDRALAAQPASVPARLLFVEVLANEGLSSLADGKLRQLAEDPAILAWPRVAAELAGRLPVDDSLAKRLDESAAAAGVALSSDRALLHAQLAGGLSVGEVAEARLARRLERFPWSLAARREAARALLHSGAHERALEILDEARAIAPDDAAVERLRSRVLLAQGDLVAARGSLERGLELDFSAEDERRLLEHLSEEQATPFHELYDESLAQILERRAGDEPVSEGTAAREVLLSRVVIDVNPDGTARRFERTVQRVLSAAGAADLDQAGWRAYPGAEEVRVLHARVLRMDGSIDEAPTGRSGWRGSISVDLPPLEPGDIVDIAIRRDDLRPSLFGDYFGLDQPLVREPDLPLRESELILISGEELPLYLHQRGGAPAPEETVEEDGQVVRRWRITDHAPQRVENLMPPMRETAVAVQASTYESWEDFGRWWWSMIDDEIRVSPEMSAKVAELVEGKEAPLDKLRALYDFVVTDIRYNAWEFGIHGYEPYSAPVIFSRGFGDCKDKSILLKAMLSEVDIEAWPVVISLENRRHEEDLSLPLVSHFNHCIAYLPEQEGIPEMFLDGTARLNPMDAIPDGDAGARVVVVRDDGVQVARVPFPAPEANRLRQEISIDLSGDDARVELVRKPRGRYDLRDRWRFTGSDEERAETAEELLSGLFGALQGAPQVQWPDYEDLGVAPESRFEVGVERITRPNGEGYEIDLTFEKLLLLTSLAGESSRETDLLLDVPWSRETVINYKLGEGARVPSLPDPVRAETEDALYERTVEATPIGLRVTETFALKTHRIPAERYAAFRELARTVDNAQATTVAVEVGQ